MDRCLPTRESRGRLRTHRTVFAVPWQGTTTGSHRLHALDQDRELAYVQYHQADARFFFDSLAASVSLQKQGEGLYRVRADDRSERLGFAVDTVGAWLRFTKSTTLVSWTWGAEYYHDDCRLPLVAVSSRWVLDRVGIQGPVADEASYDMWGAYLQDQVELGRRAELLAGARPSGARRGRGESRIRAALEPSRCVMTGRNSPGTFESQGSMRAATGAYSSRFARLPPAARRISPTWPAKSAPLGALDRDRNAFPRSSAGGFRLRPARHQSRA